MLKNKTLMFTFKQISWLKVFIFLVPVTRGGVEHSASGERMGKTVH